ncbi:DUF3592 domain-containing protein [Sulfidibacter corallicola]|uniref:DUF3592 domain-containing protein n=1 Tax=Sulfidibacter corallicola TaxID=2818388 RepID=A0A8A4TNX9_SULCO|nr:DUF3592 domain-containing protein [Sulfidibacter corallicola]QTD50601.1 DUF3592 domain-containing protein [Sulfidibacter corallicola]
MVDEVPPDLADKMIDALASSDMAHALLLYHRVRGSDLETAWKVVAQMLRDLGEEPNASARHAIIREVKEVLTMDRRTRFKRFMGALALALLCCGFSGYVLLDKSARLKTSLQSLFWSSAQATVLEVRTHSTRKYEQQRQVDRHYQDLQYQYAVEGNLYTGYRGNLQYYPGLGDEPLKKGDPITVLYNPKTPGQSLYKRSIYRLVVTSLFNLGILGFGLLVAVFAFHRERRWRHLKRLDEQMGETTQS